MIKNKVSLVLFSLLIAQLLSAQNIYIENNKFKINEQELYLNGANTPWNKWNDLGRSFDYKWWNNHFAEMHESGINSTRVWLSCDSNHSAVKITPEGYFEGLTEAFWTDMDSLMAIAQKHQIYIMGALISFDHFKASGKNSSAWVNMIKSEENMNAFAENYAVALVKRYQNNPYFFAIDVCNEIIWISNTENTSENAVPWSNIQYLIGKVAQRVHETSKVLVCASNYIKYTSTKYDGNKYSDQNLQKMVPDTNAYVDFYKIHYYAWVSRWFSGFHPNNTPAYYSLNNKPCITGEMPANEIVAWNAEKSAETYLMSIKDAYEISFQNGWQGTMAWTSNGVDEFGNLETNLAEATVAFRNQHYDLVFPSTETEYLSIKTNNYEISGTDTSLIFDITTNMQWEIITDDNWVTTQNRRGQGNTKVNLIIDQNKTGKERNTSIQIRSSKNTKTINLKQGFIENDTSNSLRNTSSGSKMVTVYPNPFEQAFTVEFNLNQNSQTKIGIYDTHGKLIAPLLDEYFLAGKHQLSFNSNIVHKGIFYLLISQNNIVQSSTPLIKI
jgi:hypothetical protein